MENCAEGTSVRADQTRRFVCIQCSGFVADEMAEIRQCSGVAGPSMRNKASNTVYGFVTGQMAEFSRCDGVTGPSHGSRMNGPWYRGLTLVRFGANTGSQLRNSVERE